MDRYVGADNMARAFLNKIHHVEHYRILPEEGEGTISLSRTEEGELQPYSRFNYQWACQYDSRVNDWYFPRPFYQVLYGMAQQVTPPYRIQPLPGDDLFPFDLDFCDLQDYYDQKAIDLVVGKTEVLFATELTDDFDLSICKASWDGEVFRIPDPHYAFNGQSTNRKAVMESYMRQFDGSVIRTGEIFLLLIGTSV
jgi:hypothetical protein